MSILWLIRYLRGYVRFEARGPFAERFLNLLARNRVPIWDGRKRGEVYSGCVAAADYKRLRPHAKKTGVRLRTTGKHGIPFRRRRYRKRAGLLAGLCVFFIFLFGMGQFVWRIEVIGNDTVTDMEVLAALDALGVSQGAPLAAIDVRDVERRMLLALPELGWFALNLRGSVARAELSERAPVPAPTDRGDPCNIVAAESGQILTLRVFEGEPMVREGDSVTAGQLLVSGVTEDGRGQSLFRHALAEVVAEVQATEELSVPLRRIEYRETGEVIGRGYLAVLGWELPVFLPFHIPLPYHVERTRSPLVLFSRELPLAWLGERYHRMEEFPVTLTKEEAKGEAVGQLLLFEDALLADAEILDKRVTGRLAGDRYELTAAYTLRRDIALKKEILVGN